LAAELFLQLEERELGVVAVDENVEDDPWILDGIQESLTVDALVNEAICDVRVFVHDRQNRVQHFGHFVGGQCPDRIYVPRLTRGALHRQLLRLRRELGGHPAPE